MAGGSFNSGQPSGSNPTQNIMNQISKLYTPGQSAGANAFQQGVGMMQAGAGHPSMQAPQLPQHQMGQLPQMQMPTPPMQGMGGQQQGQVNPQLMNQLLAQRTGLLGNGGF